MQQSGDICLIVSGKVPQKDGILKIINIEAMLKDRSWKILTTLYTVSLKKKNVGPVKRCQLNKKKKLALCHFLHNIIYDSTLK